MQPFTSLHRFISRAFHSSLVLSADPSISPPASRVFHRSRVLRRLFGSPTPTTFGDSDGDDDDGDDDDEDGGSGGVDLRERGDFHADGDFIPVEADDPDDDGFDGGDSGSLAVTRARLLPVSSSSSCLLPRRALASTSRG
ncbi:hypothetical protein M6B38_307630 [Iris pallida]|uniref:Uncharacterized protein n=1 Tax=Iris pallida TaxID=29817 RepID=A0AAX6HKP9_IRIPA|nr:hypothetical protein M6B38_307630 [Iris pallida]